MVAFGAARAANATKEPPGNAVTITTANDKKMSQVTGRVVGVPPTMVVGSAMPAS
jgi:hypothetical protein